MKHYGILALTLGLGALACGDDGSNTQSSGSIEASVRSMCEKAIGCGCELPITDQAKCEETLLAGWEGEKGRAESKGLTQDPACFNEWLAFYDALDCDARPGDIPSPSCHSWHGSTPEGQTCENNDCALGLECLPIDEGNSGLTCRPQGAIGAVCNNDWDCKGRTRCMADQCAEFPAEGEACHQGQCRDGFTCGGTGCVAQVGVGGACSRQDECAEGTYCDGTACAAKLPVGASCDPDDYLACETFCDETSETCGQYRPSVCGIVADSMGE